MNVTGGGTRDMKIEAVLKELHAVKLCWAWMREMVSERRAGVE